MPTGYTADVADGTITDLAPFAMQLARGMGACIMMRDDPWDKPIPDRFEPGTYNATKLEAAREERAKLYAMSDTECAEAAATEYAAAVAARAAAEIVWYDRRDRYLAMIAKVEAWRGAPEGIKEFAFEQLRSGLKFDCGNEFKYWSGEPIERSGAEWRAASLEKVAKDIEYHAAEDAKERARTDSRNAWIAQLRQSLARNDANHEH